MSRALQEGVLQVRAEGDDAVMIATDWNPDDERYDSTFPDHPVSRVRRILSELTASLQIDSAVNRFSLPVGDSRAGVS